MIARFTTATATSEAGTTPAIASSSNGNQLLKPIWDVASRGTAPTIAVTIATGPDVAHHADNRKALA